MIGWSALQGHILYIWQSKHCVEYGTMLEVGGTKGTVSDRGSEGGLGTLQ